MAELNFNSVFSSSTEVNDKQFPPVQKLPYYTALCALDILRQVEPTIVNDCVGYMYAIDNNDLRNPDANNWSTYAARHHKEIAKDTTFKALELIYKLAEPFKNIKNENLTTIPLTPDIVNIITTENLSDPNVMNTLELSIRYLNLVDEVSPIWYSKEDPQIRNGIANTVIHYSKVLEYFKPILNACNIKQISEDKILDYYPSRIIHQIAVGLSCLYRLFNKTDKTYWEEIDDFINELLKFCSTTLNRVASVPAISPETAIGITTNKIYSEPVMIKFKSSYMTLPEKYIFLVYCLLTNKQY